jgi:hypothetical protein
MKTPDNDEPDLPVFPAFRGMFEYFGNGLYNIIYGKAFTINYVGSGKHVAGLKYSRHTAYYISGSY